MGLLQPESGLLFWMCISFGVVFVVLAKYAFPVVLRSIDERKDFIDKQLDAAATAEQRLGVLDAEARQIVTDAQAERAQILRDAAVQSSSIVAEARRRAAEEHRRLVAEAHAAAVAERDAILRDARNEVAMLSIAISERLVRRELDDRHAQSALAERLLDEMEQQPRKNS